MVLVGRSHAVYLCAHRHHSHHRSLELANDQPKSGLERIPIMGELMTAISIPQMHELLT